ncbi:MAG: DUF2207 domain-containing protein [Phycisphaera sp. RhM]|nr:DUF2207 domain-containing protein [Phycisphaera sp. RhM]
MTFEVGVWAHRPRGWIVTFSWMLVVSSVLRGTATAELTRITVDTHLTNDGRFQVTETHDRRIDQGHESGFRSFGLGVDQSIASLKITRISADGTQTPLLDQGPANREVDGPDQFRYYPRGHIYFRYPEVIGQTELRYRLDYELVHAVSPAWGLGAGWDPLTPEDGYGSPWRRWKSIVADAKAAWPAPDRRYRLDHSVLFPERDENRDTAFELNYNLRFDTAWREVDSTAELARVTPEIEYRVRRLFEYLPAGRPAATNEPQHETRLISVAAVLIVGPVLFVVCLIFEALTAGKRFDASAVAERLRPLTPAEVQTYFQSSAPPFSLHDLLARLESEGKLSIEPVLNHEGKVTDELQLRLLVPLTSLPRVEQAFAKWIFGEDDTTTSEAIRNRARASGVDVSQYWRNLIAESTSNQDASRLPRIAFVPIAIGLWGGSLQLNGLQRDDELIVVVVVNFLALMLTLGWPKRWWHVGVARRGLLLHLIVLATAYAAMHLAVNRPYSAQAWIGSAVSILAYFSAQLIAAWMPHRGVWQVKRELYRVRQYARGELRKPTPMLDNRWIPYLEALGLGPEMKRHRSEMGQSLRAAAISRSHDHTSEAIRSVIRVPYTGIPAQRLIRESGWADVFLLSPDELNADNDDDA